MGAASSPSPSPEQVAAFFRRHRTGLVTLVFTDLVDSTALLHHLGDQAGATFLQRRRQLARDLLRSFPEGEEIETAGDSFLLIFAKPSDAVRFALLLLARFRGFASEGGVPLQERIGIHLGEVVISEHETEVKVKDLYGIQLATCARVMSLAQGGQILLTRGVFDSARQVLKGEDLPGVGPLSWVSHGLYQLKGIEEAVEVCEVGEAARSPLAAPKTSEKAQRQVRPDEEPVLGWRPAVGQAAPNTKWVLEEKLGEGGFGEVWLGRHQTLKERHVFKFCFRADRVRALKREVTLFRLLQERVGEHPHVVRIHNVYFDEPPYYLEEEFVTGKDLKTWCEAQGGIAKIPLETRLEIVAQAADALQAAHDAGIIHRDVKPGNILVAQHKADIGKQKAESEAFQLSGFDFQLSAKLTDFGIGQVISAEYLQGVTHAGFTQTMLGSTSSGTGTTMYLAPEIVAGKPASTRSDIYSLGIVLYQLLTEDFRRPLTSDWAKQVDDPLLREDLEHCFAGEPTERFAGAGQLAMNLRALPERRAELARQAAEKAERERLRQQAAHRQKLLLAGSAAALVLVAVAVALGYGLQRATAEALRAQRAAYAASMNLAQQAWEQSNVGRVRQLLEETAQYPQRGFEWYYWQRQTHLELKTLRGHLAGFNSVAFSPDGRRIVTGSKDQTAKVWDAASGRELITLRGHKDAIFSVAFSPDGQYIVTAGNDTTAKVWEAVSGKELFTLRGHSNWIGGAVFSPDGRRIVTASGDSTAKVWETSGGKGLLTLKVHNDGFWSLACSPDGQRIATGSYDQTARLWDAASGRELLTLRGHSLSVRCLAFSPDGLRIVTGSEDGLAKVWEVTTGTELLSLKGHNAGVESAHFSPDGLRIVTGSGDQTAKVWDASSGKELFTLRGHSDTIRGAAFSPDGQRIVTCSGDQTAKVWEAVNSNELRTLRRHSLGVSCLAFSPDAQRIVTGSWDQTAKVWEAATGMELVTLKSHDAAVWSAAFSPDGQRIATGSADQTAKLYEAANGKELGSLSGHLGPVFSVAFAQDGRRLVTGSADQTAKVWDSVSHKELLTLEGHGAGIWSACFSPGSQRIATASQDGTAKLWDAASGKELLTFKGHSAGIRSVAFSPNGLRIATGSDDQTVRVWEVGSGQPLLTLSGHRGAVRSVAFSPEGLRVVTSSADQTTKVWEVASGRELLTLKGHSGAVLAVALSSDGRRIGTAGEDGSARVWEAASEAEVASWRKQEAAALELVASRQREQAAMAERERELRRQDPGILREWLVLLPIAVPEGDDVRALQAEQVLGEGQLHPRAGERTGAGRSDLVWRAVRLEDLRLDFTSLVGRETSWSVAYAVTYILSEAAQSNLVLKVGSDDQAKVYLNGKSIYQCLSDRGYVADQDEVTGVELRPGVNVLVFKVVNRTLRWEGSVRFTDAAGQPVKGIRVTLTPP